jgi:isocitrate dehydrogenase
MIYSANFGDNYAMFEPAHGSAPKYRNLDKVNPTASVLAGAWMLDYLGSSQESTMIFEALQEVIAEGKTTYDLGGGLRTSQVVDCIIDKVESYLKRR